MTAVAESTALARTLAEMADAKRAGDIVGIDLRELVSYTDFLLVCTARNERQAKAIVDEVRVRMKRELGVIPIHVEGDRESRWVILDYLDCVLHVLVPEARDRYRLEHLWGEAPRLELNLPEENGEPAAASA